MLLMVETAMKENINWKKRVIDIQKKFLFSKMSFSFQEYRLWNIE